MQIVNLTPHAITLHGESGIVNCPPSGMLARLAVSRQVVGTVMVGGVILSVARSTLGEVTGLPGPVDGIIYVVSALVADAAKRSDVFAPGELLRSFTGEVIGAKGLTAYSP